MGPGDRALPRAVSAYADAFTDAFWQETERTALDHTCWAPGAAARKTD